MTRVTRAGLLWLGVAALTMSFGQNRPQPLIVLLVGPPGSGKGTQAERITAKYEIPSFSTGALLRAEVKAGTPLGQRVSQIMAKGELVPDEAVNDIVRRRIGEKDAEKGFILDGYPRTVSQAKFLDALLGGRFNVKPLVIHLDVPDDVVLERLTARGRADDKPEVIRDRLKVYHEETAPILEHYAKGDYHRIDGTKSIDEVAAAIDEVLSKQTK